MGKDEILKEISRIKKEKGNYYVSNIFNMPSEFNQIEKNDNAIVFSVNDKGVNRVYFASNDSTKLGELLEKFPSKSGIEIISKELDKETEDVLISAGYGKFAVYVRLTMQNLRKENFKNLPEKYQDVDCWKYIEYAKPEQATEIYDILYRVFKPLTSHLQDMDEILDDINNKQIVVALENGKITGLMTYEYQGKKFYLEHAINEGPSIHMHALLFASLEKGMSEGLISSYTWTREDNDRMLAFTRRYGYQLDGVKNFVYQKNDN